MNDQDEPGEGPLQFEEAEYAGPEGMAPTCAACKRTIADEYYSVNGAILCGPCRQNIAEALEGGSEMRRFLQASLFGLGAAVAGFAIYLGVMVVLGYELGLISILVGFMVGAAVRAGSGGRGGWCYQLLALFLVYTAIGASHVSARRQEWNKHGIVAKLADQTGVMGIVEDIYKLPIREGIHAPIGLLIVGFALWEAWKINRKSPIVFSGPHQVVDEGKNLPQVAPGHV